jgi:two-component system, OmpR family, response regulator
MKVLVAEDDSDIQIILRMVLSRLGRCEVTMTDQGNDVLTRAKTNRPDFILLDYMLPQMSGYEICQALKGDPETSQIPVIFLTASARPDKIKQADAAGALGFLSKPFDPMTLVTQINALLKPVGLSIGENGKAAAR